MRRLIFVMLLMARINAYSQDANGYWYGVGNVENGGSANNYMIELLVKQNGSSIKGVLNYYFKTTYRSFNIKGTYNSFSRELIIYNIPVIYFGSPVGLEVDCPTDFAAKLRVSRQSSNLKGSFISKGNFKNTCPEVYFDLKLLKEVKNYDSVVNSIKKYKEEHPIWTPSEADTLVSIKIPQRTIQNPTITDLFKKRQNVIAKEINVETDSVSVDFYDNGEIDGDSISVFFNGQLIAAKQMLSTKAIHFTLALDTTKEVNEISMFANNLGALPPNTALMVVWDGKNRYEASLASSFDVNAAVRIRRKPMLPAKK